MKEIAKGRLKAAAEVQKLGKEIAKGRVAVYAFMAVTLDGRVEARIGVSSDGIVTDATAHGAALGLRDVIIGLAEGFRALPHVRNQPVGSACESFARLYGSALTLVPVPQQQPQAALPRGMKVTHIAAAKAIAQKAIRKAKPGSRRKRR